MHRILKTAAVLIAIVALVGCGDANDHAAKSTSRSHSSSKSLSQLDQLRRSARQSGAALYSQLDGKTGDASETVTYTKGAGAVAYFMCDGGGSAIFGFEGAKTTPTVDSHVTACNGHLDAQALAADQTGDSPKFIVKPDGSKQSWKVIVADDSKID